MFIIALYNVYLQPTRHYKKDLDNILTTSGLLAIRVPVSNDQYSNMNNLNELCDCKDSLDQIKGGRQTMLTDEMTVRSTIATATKGSDYPLPLPEDHIRSVCGSNVLDALIETREIVSYAVTKAFVPAVDRFVRHYSGRNTNEKENTILDVKGGEGYTTLSDIVRDGTHLEHFHVYSKHSTDDTTTSSSSIESAVVDEALDWHTDAGLFLAFLPGQSCDNNDTTDESFRVSIPSYHNGHLSIQEQRAIFPTANENEVIVAIMLGAGAQHWLNMPDELSLKATKHAIKMMDNSARVWYGMSKYACSIIYSIVLLIGYQRSYVLFLYRYFVCVHVVHLVPLDALVHKSASESFTFSEMKKSYGINSLNKMSETGSNGEGSGLTDVTIGCGEVASSELSSNTQVSGNANTMIDRRRLHGAEGPEDCNGDDSFFCWFSCLPSSEISIDRDEKLKGGVIRRRTIIGCSRSMILWWLLLHCYLWFVGFKCHGRRMNKDIG